MDTGMCFSDGRALGPNVLGDTIADMPASCNIYRVPKAKFLRFSVSETGRTVAREQEPLLTSLPRGMLDHLFPADLSHGIKINDNLSISRNMM